MRSQQRERAALALVLLASAKAAGYAAEVEAEWARQLARTIKHVVLVLRNNPTKSVEEILSRPDMQEALSKPPAQAGQFAMSRVFAAWDKNHGPEPSNYLDSLVADVMRNSVIAPARLQQAITTDPGTTETAMRKVVAEFARRAGLSVRVAEIRAQTENNLVGIVQQGYAHKRWVSRLDANTCSHCAALHGMVIPVLEDFPPDGGARHLHVYQDLLGPPRHPRCRCRLVPA